MKKMEMADNAIQLAVTLGCGIYCTAAAIKNRSRNWLLLALFYISFGLGLLYWLLYIIFGGSTPQVFCVSELSWTAADIFLVYRLAAGLTMEERQYKSKYLWLIVAFCAVMCVLFSLRGSYFENLIMGAAMAFCGFYALRGLVFAKKNNLKKRKHICAAVMAYFSAEYILWILSCFWISDTIFNPYFLADLFLLNFALIMITVSQHKEDKICHTV